MSIHPFANLTKTTAIRPAAAQKAVKDAELAADILAILAARARVTEGDVVEAIVGDHLAHGISKHARTPAEAQYQCRRRAEPEEGQQQPQQPQHGM